MPYRSVTERNGLDTRGRSGAGKTGRRTVDEELGTSVVDDEEVDYELEDLHGRYVTLPLYHPKHIKIGIGRQGRMNGTYPKPPSTSSPIVVVICNRLSREHAIKRATECCGWYGDARATHT